MAGLRYRKKMMRRLSGANCVHGDPHIAIGAVFKTDRAGEAGRKLAMDLALGCARANGAPGNQIGEVLRRDHVEKFRSEERRVGKECRERWWPTHEKRKERRE